MSETSRYWCEPFRLSAYKTPKEMSIILFSLEAEEMNTHSKGSYIVKVTLAGLPLYLGHHMASTV
jgi:hypothetical protein